MSSLVTVIIGQVGDGLASIEKYCKGNVFIISNYQYKKDHVPFFKREDLTLNYVYINFFKVHSSLKVINNLKNELRQNYGGIDILINTCLYNFEADTPFGIDSQANILINFNCLSVMKLCEILFPLLKNGRSTVIYCALKYDYFSAIPNNEVKKSIQNNNLTCQHLKEWLNQYLEATKQNSHGGIWGETPYAVAKAGFVALKNIHKRKLNCKYISVVQDYGMKVSVHPSTLFDLIRQDRCENFLLALKEIYIDDSCQQKRLQGNQCPHIEQSRISKVSDMSIASEVKTAEEIATEVSKAEVTTAGMSTAEVSKVGVSAAEMSTAEVSTPGVKTAEVSTSQVSTATVRSAEISTVEMRTVQESTTEENVLKKRIKGYKKQERKRKIERRGLVEKRIKTNDNTATKVTTCKLQHLNVAVTIPGADLTDEDAKHIQNELKKAIFSMCKQQTVLTQTYIPLFDKNPNFSEGVVKFWCHDENSLSWLTETVTKLKLQRECKLDVINQRDIPGRVKAALFVPDFDGNLKDLQILLCNQNPLYNVHLWDLYSCERTETDTPSGVFLIFKIPTSDVVKIMEFKRRVHYGMGTINMKFITNSGFSDVPLIEGKSINNNVNNWQLVPIATEMNVSDTSISSSPSLQEALQEINGFLQHTPEYLWEEKQP